MRFYFALPLFLLAACGRNLPELPRQIVESRDVAYVSGGPAYVEWNGQFYFWGVSSRVIEWQDGIDTMCERTSVHADYRRLRREIEF